MGRYSSDSEEERKKRKKKRKKRSRSRSKSSESRYSSKQKKSKKSKKKRKNSRSRSRSVDSYRRSRSRSRGRRSRSYERSRSYDRYRSRSGSGSRSKHSRRSRSLSRSRYSRSRSRERNRRRSRSYDRYSRRSSRSRSPSRKDRKRYSEEREDPCLTIPGFSQLPPAEQAKIRMQMALKAAAAADEKIKGDVMEKPTSFKDQLAFNQAIQDIESSGFEAKYFTSNSWDKKEDSSTSSKDEFTFGTAGEIKLDSYQKKPVLINVDTDDLADPSLYVDPEEKMDRWIQKLAAMRKRKLEGDVLT